VKLRIAKKVLKDPDRYTGQQRYAAAHRLFKRASTFRDGAYGFCALLLKPQRSFHNDDQLDLRLEEFQSMYDRGEKIKFAPGEVVIPQLNIDKPVYRRDGQVHNFAVLPFPGKMQYGQVVEPPTTYWAMGEERHERPYSAKKYQIRTRGVDRGKVPPRLKFDDYPDLPRRS